jgi:outer membrane protein
MGVTWESADFVDYYYGVRPGEATAERPAFDGDAATNRFVGLASRYRLTKRLGLFALVRHTWLDDTITASPIVDTDNDYSGVLAVTYAFGI